MSSPLLFAHFIATRSSLELTLQACAAGLEQLSGMSLPRSYTKGHGGCVFPWSVPCISRSSWNVLVEFSTKIAPQLLSSPMLRAAGRTDLSKFHRSNTEIFSGRLLGIGKSQVRLLRSRLSHNSSLTWRNLSRFLVQLLEVVCVSMPLCAWVYMCMLKPSVGLEHKKPKFNLLPWLPVVLQRHKPHILTINFFQEWKVALFFS